MDENPRIRRRILSYVIVAGGLLLSFVLLRSSSWQGSTHLHTLMEVAATLLALFVGIVALVRFYTQQNNTFLFIGTGFLGTAFLDGYHAMVTSSFFEHVFPSAPASLVPWSWVASRFFLSVLLFLSWWVWQKEEKLEKIGWFRKRTVQGMAGVLTLATFLFFAFVPLPRAYYPEWFFGRPEEFVPGLFFLLAFIGYLRKGHWKTNPFEHWLVLSILIGLVGQVAFMSSSYHLFDGMFDMAHLLKKVSYVFVLIGLLISMYHLFRQAENNSAEQIRVAGEALREREEQFQDLYNNAPAAYLTVGRDARIQRTNQQTAHLLGYALDDLIGRPVFDLYADTPDGKEKARQAFQHFLAGEQTRDEELQMRRADGRLIWISLTVNPVRSADGEIVETHSIVIDITERKQAEERFQLLLEFAPVAMVIVNKRGTMVLVNALAETMFGYTREEMLGQPVEMLIPESGRRHHVSYREGYMHGPKLRKMGEGRDLSGLRKDGSEVQIEVSLRPITIGDDALVVSAIADITERKKAEEAFRESKERFQLAVEGSNSGIWDWFDVEVNEEWWSPRFYELLGYEDGEIEANLSQFADLLHPDDRERTFDLVNAHFEGRAIFDIEYRLRTKAGLYEWFQARGAVQRDAEGRPRRMVGSITNIHGRKMAEKTLRKYATELREKEIALKNVLEGTMAGYWDWYIQEDYEYMSPTFKQMFGYEDHELPNTPDAWQTIIHPDDLPGVFEVFNKHVKTKGDYPYDNEIRYYHKDGSIVWVYCRGKVIEWDEEGNPVRMVGSHVNVTALKRTEEALHRYADELKRSNEELEQFAYIASHDLQEPLRKIQAFGDRVASKYEAALDERGQDYLRRMQDAASRMQALIGDLLALSRVTSKAQPFVLVDLAEVVQGVLLDLEMQIERTGGQVEAIDLPTVEADPMQMRQLLQNLISNALKFRREDRPPSIRVYGCVLQNGVAHDVKLPAYQIHVEDNGIGFDEKYLDRIFKPFQRLHGRNAYKGTGIGLAICHKIAERHGGGITATSSPGQGTTFTITLSEKPIKEPHNEA